jgi:hypothetical protein
MNVDPVLRVLTSLGAPYALIGGHALAARGYPRFTVDVDLLTSDDRVLDTAPWTALVREGGRVESRRGDAADPLGGVVHVLLPDGTDVDIVVAKWTWEGDIIARAEPLHVLGTDIPVAQASDLVLLKLAAGGYLDLRDAAALLAIGERAALIRDVEERIADVRPDVRSQWQALLAADESDRRR